MKTTAEMNDLFGDIPEALENTIEIFNKVKHYSIDHTPLLPKPLLPEGVDEVEHLARLAFEGAYERYGKPLPKEVKEELAAKGFPAETFMDAIVCAVIESATNGNAQNFSNLVKLLGEDVQRVELAPYDKSVERMEAYFEEMRAEYNAQKN